MQHTTELENNIADKAYSFADEARYPHCLDQRICQPRQMQDLINELELEKVDLVMVGGHIALPKNELRHPSVIKDHFTRKKQCNRSSRDELIDTDDLPLLDINWLGDILSFINAWLR